jgi:hypothetical protein
VGCADVFTPFDCTLASGSIVSINSNGTFSFTPSRTLATGAPTDDTFQYVITDQPAAGAPQTATATVTIHVYDKVWYVKQGASGNGTSSSPPGSFVGIDAASGVREFDVAGGYIFVHDSGALNSTITLEANQHLLGEGVASRSTVISNRSLRCHPRRRRGSRPGRHDSHRFGR